MIKLNKKRQRARRNLTAYIAILDLGYNLEDIVKVNTVDSRAAIVDFLALGQEIKNSCYIGDFLTLG